METIQTLLKNSKDIVIREFCFGNQSQVHAALVFIDGMVNKSVINDNIVKPLIYDTHLINSQALHENDIKFIRRSLLAVGDVNEKTGFNELIASLLYGNAIFLLDGSDSFLDIDAKGWQTRAIEEPKVEQTVRGPREGFTETLRTNTAMLRRKIHNPNLVLEQMVLGRRTHTLVYIAYVDGVAPPALVEEVKRRLNIITIDDILESGYIEQFIEDAPYSPFATVGNSEKPDRVAARILEGRVAILVDGTPFVLTVPSLFIEGFQAAEDYYSRPYYASLVRFIRFIAFIITLLAPGLYVALESFQPELVPTPLLLTMAAAVEGTPFPAVVEALLMGIIFELLREGGIRLPATIGPALSIVGALIIGDSAVKAGLIGAPMVIVIALTAVSSFLVISHTDAVTLLRFGLIIMAGFLGIYGLGIGLIAILFHLCSLRSFGLTYLSPIDPISWSHLKDTFIRAPLRFLVIRRPLIREIDPERASFRLDLNKPKSD
ncbi:spore germination protein [Syntrophomonas erecta subsp. sporosyntropha]